MTDFRQGVLIHNFNEDNFGRELVDKGKLNFPTPESITHSAYQDPRLVMSYHKQQGFDSGYNSSVGSGSDVESIRASGEKPVYHAGGMEASLLFGHSGDVRTTRGLRQKAYITSAQYFYQDPETAKGSLKNPYHCEKFYEGSHPIEVSRHLAPSKIAMSTRKNWEKLRDPYVSVYKKELVKADPTEGLETKRIPRVKGEFTQKVDAVCIKRTY
ncbi:unnamed protein product [Amoebophrya sp. A25]|nr:unnamed protein product [Amoebophrya sp. A25]|eukprot:GSA25T00004830001.1